MDGVVPFVLLSSRFSYGWEVGVGSQDKLPTRRYLESKFLAGNVACQVR